MEYSSQATFTVCSSNLSLKLQKKKKKKTAKMHQLTEELFCDLVTVQLKST